MSKHLINMIVFATFFPLNIANAWHVCDRGGSYYHERSQRAEACKKAAEQGDPEAQLKYGLMLVSGPKDKRDIQGAVKWIRASAENGRADAQLLLGGILSEAKPDDEFHDLVEAYAWLAVAGAKRDMQRIAERMNDEQRAEAEKRAQKYLKKFSGGLND